MQRFSKAMMWATSCLMVSAISAGCTQQENKMCRNSDKGQEVQRVGSVIGIDKANIEEYKRLHAAVWPGVLKKIADCHIQNYSIYLAEVKPNEFYLFSYFEYTGDDLAKEIDEKMKTDETTKKWWSYTDPLQNPVETRKEGEWWHELEEVFHTD